MTLTLLHFTMNQKVSHSIRYLALSMRFSLNMVSTEWIMAQTISLRLSYGVLKDEYGLTGFKYDFITDFETFLQSVDTDDATVGNQPYTDPVETPILTLEDTLWFGPSETWPKEVFNYPYIEFWHRLDDRLSLERGTSGLGIELLGEARYAELFDAGYLAENPSFYMAFQTIDIQVLTLGDDQAGNQRPASTPNDIGAIELQ